MERSDLHPGMTVTLKPAEELNRINYVMPDMMKYADQSFEIEK